MRYVATEPVLHNGKWYRPGDRIEDLDEAAAQALVEAEAAVPAPEPEPEPAAEKPKRGRRQA